MKRCFDDYYSIMRAELKKREHLFTLHAMPSLSYEDFCQDLLIHIHEKFHLYDQDRNFNAWFSTVFRHFWSNWLRNKLGKIQPICVRCPLYVTPDTCLLTKSQHPDTTCPLYAKWKKKKESLWQIEMSVSIENHVNEVHSQPDRHFNYEKAKKIFEKELKKELTDYQWKIYTIIFIQNHSEAECTRLLKFKPEKSRGGSCKMVRDIKQIILKKSKDILIKKGLEDAIF